jgi:hypothetical protein
MAVLHYNNALVECNGTDLSNDVESVTLNFSSEMLDATAMGDDTRKHKGGLKDWSIEVNFHQDFEASQVDATLFTIVGTTSCWEVRPQNVCSSANNPIYSGVGTIESYNPQGGSVGALLDAPVTVQSFGSLNRASSS